VLAACLHRPIERHLIVNLGVLLCHGLFVVTFYVDNIICVTSLSWSACCLVLAIGRSAIMEILVCHVLFVDVLVSAEHMKNSKSLSNCLKHFAGPLGSENKH